MIRRIFPRDDVDNRAPDEVLRWKDAEIEALRAALKKLKEETR